MLRWTSGSEMLSRDQHSEKEVGGIKLSSPTLKLHSNTSQPRLNKSFYCVQTGLIYPDFQCALEFPKVLLLFFTWMNCSLSVAFPPVGI